MTKITVNSLIKLRKNEHILKKRVKNQEYFFDTKQALIYELNSVGSAIMLIVEKEKSLKVSQIVQCVYEEYEVDKKQAKKDALEFLKILLDKQLVSVS